MNILAVDDEMWGLAALSGAIQKAVPKENLQSFGDPLEALECAKHNAFDIAFLDAKMPELDGLTLAAELKKRYPKINIIFVTGYSEYAGEAFALHASGYVNKPVSPGVVLEQMENLRFALAEHIDLPLKLGRYSFDHTAQRVYTDGRDALLKPREYHLFCLLASHPEQFFSPEELFRRIWGDDPNGNVNTVYVHVSSLRKKLGMDENSAFTIERKRGQGYRVTRKDQ